MRLKGSGIKKRWKVCLMESGSRLCQDFGPYRFRFVALIVSFLISFRIWAEEFVSLRSDGCQSRRHAGVFEIIESWTKDPVDRSEELYQEMNALFEKEGLSLKD